MLRALVIKQEGDKWVLYSHDGKKKLGTHASEAEAQAQEAAIKAAEGYGKPKKDEEDEDDEKPKPPAGTPPAPPKDGAPAADAPPKEDDADEDDEDDDDEDEDEDGKPKGKKHKSSGGDLNSGRYSRRFKAAARPARVRTEKFRGKDHLVVPVVALVEGVIHASNADTPELVLSEEFTKTLSQWDGRPVMLNHPKIDNTAVGANSPKVLDEFQIGNVFNARVDGKKLKMDAFLDQERMAAMGGEAAKMLASIQSGKMVEVSVGTFVVAEPKKGRLGDAGYDFVWRDIASDHLAFLPEGVAGACSIEMGCGAPRSAGEGEGHEFHGNQHTGGGGGGEGSEDGKGQLFDSGGFKNDITSKIMSDALGERYGDNSASDKTVPFRNGMNSAAHDINDRGVGFAEKKSEKMGNKLKDKGYKTFVSKFKKETQGGFHSIPQSLQDELDAEERRARAAANSPTNDEYIDFWKEVGDFETRQAGEGEGHEFHGNQWSSGEGGGGKSGDKAFADAYKSVKDQMNQEYADRQKAGQTGPMSLDHAQAIEEAAQRAGDKAKLEAELDQEEAEQGTQGQGVWTDNLGATAQAAHSSFDRMELGHQQNEFDGAENDAVLKASGMGNAELDKALVKAKADAVKAVSGYNSAYKSWNTQRGDVSGHDPAKQKRLDKAETKVAKTIGHWSGLGRAKDFRNRNSEARAASCGCGGQGSHYASAEARSMDKKARVAVIIASGKTCFKAADAAVLEQLSDESIKELETHIAKAAPERKELTQEEFLAANPDIKAAVEAQKAEVALTPEQREEKLLSQSPAIAKIVKDHKTAETNKRTTIISQLKVAQKSFTEDELGKMETPQLEKIALMLGQKPSYEGAGAPRAAETHVTEEVPAPPSLAKHFREARSKSSAN